MSSTPRAAAASEKARFRSYQTTDQPRSSAASASASRYMTVSATVWARLSLMRSSTVVGKLRADADGDPRDRDGHVRSQSLKAVSRPPCGGFANAFDKLDRIAERDLARPGAVPIATDGPRSFVVVRVRGQPVGEVDPAAVEERTIRPHRDQHGGVAVLGHPNRCRAAAQSTMAE